MNGSHRMKPKTIALWSHPRRMFSSVEQSFLAREVMKIAALAISFVLFLAFIPQLSTILLPEIYQ